jgi:hypothetical protein
VKGDRVKRLKELEAENARLRRAMSGLTLDKMILAGAARGNCFRPIPSHRHDDWPTDCVSIRASGWLW